MRWLIFLLLSSSLIACETIQFRYEDRALASETNLIKNYSFHHIGVLGLIEFSDPVSPQNICSESYTPVAIQTERDIKIWGINYVGILLSGGLFTSAYSPQAVTVFCKSKVRTPIETIESEVFSREVASANSLSKFKVLSVKNNKALIQFIKPIPNSKVFILVHSDAQIRILKKKKRRAVIAVGDAKLEKGNYYKASHE